MMKTLLLVDLQNDFFPGGALPVPEADAIIPFINTLQTEFDLVLATQDWHPLHHKSFALEHGKEVGEDVLLEGITQILWPVHCVQNSYGAELVKELDKGPIEKLFYKGVDEKIDSYSAFYDNAHKRSTGLIEYLREKKITEISVVGLATDYCVKHSVLDALKEKLKVFVYLKGCKGIDLVKGDIEKALHEMRRAGAILID